PPPPSRPRRGAARFIFLLPPALATLRERLQLRGSDDPGAIATRLEIAPHDPEEGARFAYARSDDPGAIATRLEIARHELEEGARFDYAVVNDRLETCVAEVLEILAAEREGDTAEVRARHGPGPAIAKLLAATWLCRAFARLRLAARRPTPSASLHTPAFPARNR